MTKAHQWGVRADMWRADVHVSRCACEWVWDTCMRRACVGRVSSCSSHGDAGAGGVCEGTGFSPRTDPEQEAVESQPVPPAEVGGRALHRVGVPGASGGGARPGLMGAFRTSTALLFPAA